MFDYVTNPERLKKPLIRLESSKKENSISIKFNPNTSGFLLMNVNSLLCPLQLLLS